MRDGCAFQSLSFSLQPKKFPSPATAPSFTRAPSFRGRPEPPTPPPHASPLATFLCGGSPSRRTEVFSRRARHPCPASLHKQRGVIRSAPCTMPLCCCGQVGELPRDGTLRSLQDTAFQFALAFVCLVGRVHAVAEQVAPHGGGRLLGLQRTSLSVRPSASSVPEIIPHPH